MSTNRILIYFVCNNVFFNLNFQQKTALVFYFLVLSSAVTLLTTFYKLCFSSMYLHGFSTNLILRQIQYIKIRNFKTYIVHCSLQKLLVNIG